MVTSVALLSAAGWSLAQAPQWDNKVPAKTKWAAYPTPDLKPPTQPAPLPSALPVPIPLLQPVVPPKPLTLKPYEISAPAPIPLGDPASQNGTRVILFQKPPEVPLEPKPLTPKSAEQMPADPAMISPILPTVAEPSKAEVFRMGGDDVRHTAILKMAGIEKPTTVSPSAARAAATPPRQVLLEPGYVVHRRLFFEDNNAERYGWNLGIAQPIVSTVYFYKDVLLWPSNIASNLRERYDTNAGKFLPGSPVPYYLYPPEITLFGGTLGAAAIIGTVFLIP